MERTLFLLFIILIITTRSTVSLYPRNTFNTPDNQSNLTTRSTESAAEGDSSSSRPNYLYTAELAAQVGNNIVTFIRGLIPALQPKVDFIADSITDAIDATNARLMQKIENTNNTIVAVESFFNNMYETLIVNANGGKGAFLPSRLRQRRQLRYAVDQSHGKPS